MNIKAYPLRHFMRVSSTYRKKYNLELGSVVTGAVDKKSTFYVVIKGFEKNPILIDWPAFKGSKEIKLTQKGKTVYVGASKYSKKIDFESKRPYLITDDNTLKKLNIKEGGTVNVFGTDYVNSSDALKEYLGDNYNLVVSKDGIYLPIEFWSGLKKAGKVSIGAVIDVVPKVVFKNINWTLGTCKKCKANLIGENLHWEQAKDAKTVKVKDSSYSAKRPNWPDNETWIAFDIKCPKCDK